MGPNTVIQAIKKIILSEPSLDLHVHVAMDSIIVKSEVRASCLVGDTSLPRQLPGRYVGFIKKALLKKLLKSKRYWIDA